MLNIKNTTEGYLKDVEIKGNTIQDAENLADIRSVGDKLENQELYKIDILCTSKNLIKPSKLLNYNMQSPNTISDVRYATKEFAGVKPNTDYVFSTKSDTETKYLIWLDKNKKFISRVDAGSRKFITAQSPQNAEYCQLYVYSNTVLDRENEMITNEWQLEEGTQPTPYEPYQEDKLTILSPVQLEKVGDVADRIIEKDGVWGVEKNVETVVFDGSEGWFKAINKNTSLPPEYRLTNAISDYKLFGAYGKGISNKYSFIGNQETCWVSTQEGFGLGSSAYKGTLYVCCNVATLDEFKTHINKFSVKYIVETPQFIPLPHDQQVKLRTFAGQTNIHFETEIQGTIKAQVPKSLGATVNSHTEQIGNLSKELDRVKKLEESTVSTVVTESDFTTVEETSNGYFEDVKLEGRTLVNLVSGNFIKVGDSASTDITNTIECKEVQITSAGSAVLYKNALIKNNTTYTIIADVKTPTSTIRFAFGDSNNYSINGINLGNKSTTDYTRYIATITSGEEECSEITIGYHGTLSVDTVLGVKNLVVLEGAHTQNPPSYFEGLKSVGQSASEDGVDEMVVSTLDTSVDIWNDIDIEFEGKYYYYENGLLQNDASQNSKKFYVSNNDSVKIVSKGTRHITYWDNDNFISGELSLRNDVKILNIPKSCNIIRVGYNITIEPPSIYTKSDKKRLLYYNEETQTWEKPILREWDSIEKHSDGKYYYHKRSGEVVLNGSEFWELISSSDSQDIIGFNGGGLTTSSNSLGVVCDKFPTIKAHGESANFENIFLPISTRMQIRILKSKLSTQDVAGFKQWLQANPVTVAYQLAEEKVYECTNIDLITYENETNYIVNCGAISPKSILKVHNNISNVVKILQEKVNLLESNIKASQEVQDMMILETDMRMLDIELALMEFMPMTLNLGGSNMLRSATYFNFLKNHIINETYEKEYLENVINKYLATGRINQDEYDELYKMLYPPVYDIELPIEY